MVSVFLIVVFSFDDELEYLHFSPHGRGGWSGRQMGSDLDPAIGNYHFRVIRKAV